MMDKIFALTLRRAPFMIFSKTAPKTLPKYNVNTDFCYYFFSDSMEEYSGISIHDLTCNNNRNAKTDFPIDYESYFIDDANVCQKYPHPNVMIITEPWQTPATTTILETRKTSIEHDNKLFMLGCFAPHDDIELGISNFRASYLPKLVNQPSELLSHIPTSWYKAAFQQLPLSTILIDGKSGNVIVENKLAEETKFLSNNVKQFIEKINTVPSGYDVYQMNEKFNNINHRVWAWRPTSGGQTDDDDIIAIASRPKHTKLPDLIRSTLSPQF